MKENRRRELVEGHEEEEERERVGLECVRVGTWWSSFVFVLVTYYYRGKSKQLSMEIR